MSTEASDFGALAAEEIYELHRVLQAWLRAEGSDNSSVVLDHFDESFRMISPSGVIIPYSKFASGLPAIRGSRPGLIMEISDVEIRFSDSSTALINYHEHQAQNGKTTDRWSTALLRRKTENKIPQWVHLQETLIS